MREARTVAPARWRAWLAPALLAAIVLGILGMHALAHHAVATDDPAHSASHAAPAPETGGATGEDGSRDSGKHSTGHVMMLCGAMLLGAAVGLLLARGPRTVALQRATAARLRHVLPALVPQRAGTGPPYVWEFSVVRC